jgi:hypothetical protein
MSIATTTRNADLGDLISLLKAQREVRLDAVVPASAIRSVNGVLHIPGMGTAAAPDDVASFLAAAEGGPADGRFLPTTIMDGQIGDKLGVPIAYLRKMREQRPDLYDANVNLWLHGGHDADWTAEYPADGRKFLVRTFADSEGGIGVGRALLADRFKVFDNYDALMTVLDVVREKGIRIEVVSADLSETRMCVRVYAPDLAFPAPRLLDGYRSPLEGLGTPDSRLRRLVENYSPEHLGWDASKGETPPIVFAGFEITNGETGGSALALSRRIVVNACKNGLKIAAGSLRKVHLGGRMDEGVVEWSGETQQRNIELIRSQVADYVTAALDVDATREVLGEIEAKAGTELAEAAEVIKIVARELSFSEDVERLVLDHFIRGGQTTAGGVLNAVTSAAQVVSDPDVAYDMETAGMKALDLAVASAR